MVLIHTSRDVKATLDSVWNVISDIDREPEFWHGTKSIKNISKTGNTIEREVVIAFRNSKCREIVKLDNKKSINIDIIQGPIRGRKTIILKTIKDHTTRIDVEWDIRLSGFYGIFTGMIKKHVLRGAEEALERISEKVSYA
ncbi:MAG TPA: SRPBCC family protein [Candidatus Bathyarchaeia archaeon]|nr:SRPBCC family protein [Candidatus Bathyarchaeia archaeon]